MNQCEIDVVTDVYENAIVIVMVQLKLPMSMMAVALANLGASRR
jgi:hypothetical protein